MNKPLPNKKVLFSNKIVGDDTFLLEFLETFKEIKECAEQYESEAANAKAIEQYLKKDCEKQT